MSGTFFSRRWLWWGLKCVTVVKLTFSILFFTCVASFLILVFWAPFGEKWGSSSILLFFQKAGANFGPSRGGSPGSVFMSKTFVSLKVFHLFLHWLASGAPLGPWPPPWRPFLDLSGGISGLGSSLGPFLGASVSFLVCFYCFSTSHGIIFSTFQA